MGRVEGRIDHLAIDLSRKRLFIAELGNGSVGVVDLGAGRLANRLTGFEEPQGLAWSSRLDRLYVGSGGDGTLRTFSGESLLPGPMVKLGADADNVRLDSDQKYVHVGFGAGALAVLDAKSLDRNGDIAFKGHPESFQLEQKGTLGFVNVPDARQVVVVDRTSKKVTAHWQMDLGANYPMALDEKRNRLLVVFRSPAVLAVFSTQDGHSLGRVPTCSDADDVFIDERRERAYVICGSGEVVVFETRSGKFVRIWTVATQAGARTGYFSPELDRLYVAVRASRNEQAAVWVFRPAD